MSLQWATAHWGLVHQGGRGWPECTTHASSTRDTNRTHVAIHGLPTSSGGTADGNFERAVLCWLPKSLCSHRHNNFSFGKHLTTRFGSVSEHFGKISYEMERSLRQKIIEIGQFGQSIQSLRQFCHLGNQIKYCEPGLFQDASFASDLQESRSTSGEIQCVIGSHTFVPTSWSQQCRVGNDFN